MKDTIPITGKGRILITTEELMDLLTLSRRPAEKVGEKAKAKRKIGRAVRWNVQRVQEYVYSTEDLE